MLFTSVISEMVPAPIVIKLKPVQTKKLVASNLNTSEVREIPRQAIVIDTRRRADGVTVYDSRIAERTPIEELKAGKHRLPVWADGLFEVTPLGQPRRRRKLTHLSQEEKILRRKLKNRVAAQNARDKKKSESEGLKTENDELRALVEQLREERIQQQYENEALRTENVILRKRLGIKTEEDESESSRTPSSVHESVLLQPIDSDDELNGTGSPSKTEMSMDVDSMSDSGSSPDARVAPKVEPFAKVNGDPSGAASRPNLMIRIDSA